MKLYESNQSKELTALDVATAVNSYIREQKRKRAQALLDSYRQSADLGAVERAQRADKALDRISD